MELKVASKLGYESPDTLLGIHSMELKAKYLGTISGLICPTRIHSMELKDYFLLITDMDIGPVESIQWN